MTAKRPKLPPNPIHFEGLNGGSGMFAITEKNKRWARVIAFRPPLEGEYYLSGAVVEAFKARNDMTSSYWIVEPIQPKPVILHEYCIEHA